MTDYEVIDTLSTPTGYKYQGDTVTLKRDDAAPLLAKGFIRATKKASVKKEQDNGSNS